MYASNRSLSVAARFIHDFPDLGMIVELGSQEALQFLMLFEHAIAERDQRTRMRADGLDAVHA